VSTLQLYDLPGCDISTLSRCVGLVSLIVNNCGVIAVDSIASLPHLEYVDVKVSCCVTVSVIRWLLSFRSDGYFPSGPRLAGIRMSPFWILLELRMMAVVVTTGAINCS